jgi:hypothetical protein
LTRWLYFDIINNELEFIQLAEASQTAITKLTSLCLARVGNTLSEGEVGAPLSTSGRVICQMILTLTDKGAQEHSDKGAGENDGKHIRKKSSRL